MGEAAISTVIKNQLKEAMLSTTTATITIILITQLILM